MNKDRYDNAFVEVFSIKNIDVLDDSFSKETVDDWDSVHQLNLVALVEEAFDIMLDPEEIMDFISYKAGKDILKKYEIEI